MGTRDSGPHLPPGPFQAHGKTLGDLHVSSQSECCLTGVSSSTEKGDAGTVFTQLRTKLVMLAGTKGRPPSVRKEKWGGVHKSK